MAEGCAGAADDAVLGLEEGSARPPQVNAQGDLTARTRV